MQDELGTIGAQIRGLEREVAARLAKLDQLGRDERAELAARVKCQRQELKTLRVQLNGAVATRDAIGKAEIEKALEKAELEKTRTIKALHFPGFLADHVVGEGGGAFLGVRDVWLEALHASAQLSITPAPVPALRLELGAPEQAFADGSAADGAVLSLHLGGLRVWGDSGSRVPTLNVRKGATISLRVRVSAEASFVDRSKSARRPKPAASASAPCQSAVPCAAPAAEELETADAREALVAAFGEVATDDDEEEEEEEEDPDEEDLEEGSVEGADGEGRLDCAHHAALPEVCNGQGVNGQPILPRVAVNNRDGLLLLALPFPCACTCPRTGAHNFELGSFACCCRPRAAAATAAATAAAEPSATAVHWRHRCGRRQQRQRQQWRRWRRELSRGRRSRQPTGGRVAHRPFEPRAPRLLGAFSLQIRRSGPPAPTQAYDQGRAAPGAAAGAGSMGDEPSGDGHTAGRGAVRGAPWRRLRERRAASRRDLVSVTRGAARRGVGARRCGTPSDRLVDRAGDLHALPSSCLAPLPSPVSPPLAMSGCA